MTRPDPAFFIPTRSGNCALTVARALQNEKIIALRPEAISRERPDSQASPSGARSDPAGHNGPITHARHSKNQYSRLII